MITANAPPRPLTSAPGKTVAGRRYLHVTALGGLDAPTRARVDQCAAIVGLVRGDDYNVVRLELDGAAVALLQYPGFFDEPFPALAASWLVDPDTASVNYRTYADSLNPPILHRKELLLPLGHPRREEFAALTAACEAIGLFDQPTRIGYRCQWEQQVRAQGYRLDGHQLVPLGNDESAGPQTGDAAAPLHAGWAAARHLTALTRYGFSAPIQSLARYGFLDGSLRLFDYGCGRGDDVRGLRENGLAAAGWDPFYAPDQPREAAELVNLGFVINVIEDRDERLAALLGAWSLTRVLLVVSVMLANQNDPRGQAFRDGVMTRRGTFQKYYTQAEIKAFLEAALDEEAIPVAPGVLYCFRDKAAQQRFLAERYRSRRNRLRAPAVVRRERPATPRRDRAEARDQTYREPLERLWQQWLALGRAPDKSELEDASTLIAGFGSLGRALRHLAGRNDLTEVERARDARSADLLVYLALDQFERRRPYKHLEPGLQRDLKAFFGDYAAAQAAARALLFRIADVAAIAADCRQAAEHGLGWLQWEQEAGAPGAAEPAGAHGALTLHSSLVEQLSPLLRVYVGCAAVLYGDYRHADLVKIHIGSGKVSLMRYDDFAGQALPRMLERVKIKLREQDIDYFAYGTDYEPPLLYHKSRYINEESPHYPEQVAFDEQLAGLGLFDLSGYGPKPGDLAATLAAKRWQVDGFALVRSTRIPDLDDPCGRYFRFREFIACGETQAATGLANLPVQVATYNALLDLAEQVLDPVIDWFGMIRLTYGFCSPALARAIRARGGGPIDPARDQHAAHELNRRGRPVCPRLGAAVDFIVEDEDMLEVARWVAAHTPFDRLYVYGPDRPLHVSHGPEARGEVVQMRRTANGRWLPRVVPREQFVGTPAGAGAAADGGADDRPADEDRPG